MKSEIFVSPAKLADYPGMPGLLQCACEHAASLNDGLIASQFIGDMDDAELHEFVNLCVAAQSDKTLLMAMCIFAAMLAVSEGLVIAEDDELPVYLTRLAMMAQAEGLSRQGILALDLSTLTLEAFDVYKVPRTPRGRQADLHVIKLPPH